MSPKLREKLLKESAAADPDQPNRGIMCAPYPPLCHSAQGHAHSRGGHPSGFVPLTPPRPPRLPAATLSASSLHSSSSAGTACCTSSSPRPSSPPTRCERRPRSRAGRTSRRRGSRRSASRWAARSQSRELLTARARSPRYRLTHSATVFRTRAASHSPAVISPVCLPAAARLAAIVDAARFWR